MYRKSFTRANHRSGRIKPASYHVDIGNEFPSDTISTPPPTHTHTRTHIICPTYMVYALHHPLFAPIDRYLPPTPLYLPLALPLTHLTPIPLTFSPMLHQPLHPRPSTFLLLPSPLPLPLSPLPLLPPPPLPLLPSPPLSLPHCGCHVGGGPSYRQCSVHTESLSGGSGANVFLATLGSIPRIYTR